MKYPNLISMMRACLVAVVFMAAASTTTLRAAPPALNGQIALRALTPQDLKDYSLTGLQGASGLSAVGVGQPAYLEALVNIAIAPSNIVSVTWNLTNKPAGSAAALLTSPLGTNVPTYKMADRLTLQVAGRTLLRPDVTGQYRVMVTIVTTDSGTTNLTQDISCSTYLGVQICAFCHSGGVAAEDVYTHWINTPHASMFANAIDGLRSDHYSKNCISCHTVGYDANTNAVNGGFDDVAKQLGWTFPTNLVPGNWASMQTNYPSLANLANIQCENCHGPGSEHAYAFGNTNLSNWPRLGVSFGAGDCAQCHDSKNNHVKNAEWNNSGHAIAPVETEAGCVRCHTAKGFADYTAGVPATATPFEVITCAACHDPHDASNPHQLRTAASVTLMDKVTTITPATAGSGVMCMNCHMSRRNATNYVEVTAGSSRFGPHHGPQADMLAGANAMNFGKFIPSSAHRDVVEESCVECHMQTVASTNAAFTKAGGHTFKMSSATTNGTVQLLDACKGCHGPINSFNFPRQDYDGNGVVEGVQTEVKGLLSKLAILLPPVGVAKTNHSPSNISINSSWTRPQLRAGYNYLFVVEDGSYGIHNLSYAVGLLKESIASLTGDSNNDGLPDSWQVQYFGSANNSSAAPNATPAGDGIPNWLKYALGLDPNVPGIVLPDGVVWANSSPSSGGTNIQIYTAAEVVFNTEVGKMYQLQSISSLGGGWQNVGDAVTGTGNSYSFVTPTRNNKQQFYRVVSTP